MNYSLAKKFTFGSLMMFALPTTIMMIFTSLYTIIDGVFVSRFVGTNALSSINIVYPAINIVLGIAVMFSTGSCAIVAKKMGEGKAEEARASFTSIIYLNIIAGAVTAVLGNLFAAPIVRLLGASDLLMSDCITYMRWQMAFAPALMLQILFQMYFITEGRPGLGLFLTILAGLSNAVLDYILIVPLKLGVAGAAIATVTGYMIPAVFGLIYFAVSRKALWLVKPRLSAAELKETLINGSSEMVTNLSSGIITFLFNLLMMHYAGEDGVAAITYNYGSRNTKQLKQVFKTSLIFTGVTSFLVFATAQLAGGIIVTIFAHPGTAVYDLARHGFMVFSFGYLFSGVNIFSSALFTALSNGRVSAVISFVRTLCLIVLCLLLLPLIMGLDGVWLAVPVAEAGGFLLCLFFLRKHAKTYSYI